jgi:Uma2 family endonuclease
MLDSQVHGQRYYSQMRVSEALTLDNEAIVRSTEFKTYRWTVDRYDRLADTGIFDRQRVELLAGRIVEMPPQEETHAAGISLTGSILTGAFGDRYVVRVRMPVNLNRFSKPEPDLAVVPGSPRDYLIFGSPTNALLIVEVADASHSPTTVAEKREHTRASRLRTIGF